MSSVKRLLIVKLSAMGDVLHALPVSAAIGASFPHVEIVWVIEEAFAPLLEGNPYLAQVLKIPKLRPATLKDSEIRRRYMAQLRAVRRLRCDVALDLQGLTKSAIVAVASGANQRVGYHFLREASRWLIPPAPRRTASTHVVDHYLDVAHYIGADTARPEFPIVIPADADLHAKALLESAGIEAHQPFISINPSAGHRLKLWGAANYGRLADALQQRHRLPIVLVTSDTEVAAAVKAAAHCSLVDLSGKTSLHVLMAVLRCGALHICGDTGSGHLAAAFDRPVVSLIGPTDPVRACPFGQGMNVIAHGALCDAACTDHHCVFALPRCLEAITVDEIVMKTQSLLANVGELPLLTEARP